MIDTLSITTEIILAFFVTNDITLVENFLW